MKGREERERENEREGEREKEGEREMLMMMMFIDTGRVYGHTCHAGHIGIKMNE